MGSPADETKCPGCGAGLAPDAVICVKCGLNTVTGKRFRSPGPAGSMPDSTRRLVAVAIAAIVVAFVAVGGFMWHGDRIERMAFGEAIRQAQAEKSTDKGVWILEAIVGRYPGSPYAGEATALLQKLKEQRVLQPSSNSGNGLDGIKAMLHAVILPEIEFRQAKLDDIVAFLNSAFREASGPHGKSVNLVLVSPSGRTAVPTVTMVGRKMTFDTLLDLVAEAAGYSYKADGDTITLRPNGQPPSSPVLGDTADTAAMRQLLSSFVIPEVDFRQADIHDIVDFIGMAYHQANPTGATANIVLIPHTVTGAPATIPEITMAAEAMPFATVLDIVSKVGGCTWTAAGNTVIIRPAAPGTADNTAFTDSNAQFSWGNVQFHGWAGPTNYQEAVRWYRKAAEQGHPEAQFFLGHCLFTGKGIDQNRAEAVSWWRRAADGSNTSARTCLGACYVIGTGVPQDQAKGMAMIRAGAEDGDDEAQHMLGLTFYSRGPTTNIEETLYWLEESAGQGNDDALADLIAVKKQLAKKAFDLLGTRKNDPRFAADSNLVRVANAVVKMKDRTVFPTDEECDDLLESCDRLLDGDLQDEMRLAVIGSQKLFEHEQEMMAKGYRRYAGVFMDKESIAMADRSAKERVRMAAEWQTRRGQEEVQSTRRVIREFSTRKAADEHAKALRNQNHSGNRGPRYFVQRSGRYWTVYAEDEQAGPTYAAYNRGSPGTATVRYIGKGTPEYNDYMRNTFGNRVGVTRNAGAFGPIINPDGINW